MNTLSKNDLIKKQEALLKKLRSKKLEEWQINALNSECELLEMEIAKAL